MANPPVRQTIGRRILIVAYYFEPQSSVGVFRTVRLVDYFLAQGWQVEIVTVGNPDPQFEPVRNKLESDLEFRAGVTMHRIDAYPVKPLWQIPASIITRLGSLIGRSIDAGRIASHFWQIDMQWGFAIALKRRLASIARKARPEVIYVSCPPFSAAAPAIDLADDLSIPGIVDFRDSWVPSPYKSGVKPKYDNLERSILKKASALIVNTEADLKLYEGRIDTQKLHWIPNGFDMPLLGPLPESPGSKAIRFVYLGAWDNGPRDPRPFLAALRNKKWDWQLSTYANDHAAIVDAATDVGVLDRILCHPFVPKEELRSIVGGADCLVLIQGYGRDRSIPVTHVAAKTYDYLATGKQIIGLTAPGANYEILEKYPDSACIALPDDAEQISAALDLVYDRFVKDSLPTLPNADFVNKYSPEKLGEQFVKLIERSITAH